MVNYKYVQQINPPAPFVAVTLSDPVGGNSLTDLPAQLDTAADRTIVPLAAINSLGLRAHREQEFAGLGGVPAKLSLFWVQLSNQPLSAVLVEVAGHPGEHCTLLGRDVLNGHRLTLDGPNLTLEIG